MREITGSTATQSNSSAGHNREGGQRCVGRDYATVKVCDLKSERRRSRRYDFGDVRVETLTLLTLTALSGERSCGVVIAKFSGQAVTLRSSPTVLADTLMSASTLTGI
jgi:hypothetical protein